MSKELPISQEGWAALMRAKARSNRRLTEAGNEPQQVLAGESP